MDEQTKQNYMQIVEQTDDEKMAMYMKLPKEEIISMLIECNKHLPQPSLSHHPSDAELGSDMIFYEGSVMKDLQKRLVEEKMSWGKYIASLNEIANKKISKLKDENEKMHHQIIDLEERLNVQIKKDLDFDE